VRGVHGSTARTRLRGATLAWRPGMTISPAITANDRLRLVYRSAAN
jgi:hypothetical protein